jgi:hypothetical protein
LQEGKEIQVKAKNKAEYVDVWMDHLDELGKIAMWLKPEQFQEWMQLKAKIASLIEDSATHKYDCWQCKHCRKYELNKNDRCTQCNSKRGQEQ